MQRSYHIGKYLMRHRAVKIRNYLKAKQHCVMINKTQVYNFRDNEENKKGNKTNRYPHKKKRYTSTA